MHQPKYLTLQQLGERWGYDPNTLRNAISRGTIPIPVARLMPKGDPRFSLDDVERHEAKATGTSAGQPIEVAA